MLLSIVFQLKSLERGAIPNYTGAAVRAEFLNWMGKLDAGQADDLHDGNKLRPYTISDLMGNFSGRNGYNILEPGQEVWFRATTLRQEESETLRRLVDSGLTGRRFKLGGIKFEVQKVAKAGEHAWAGESSYESMVERFSHSKSMPSNSMDILFASFTTFHSGKVHIPLPIPETVLGSWLGRWNQFAAGSLPQAVNDLKEAKFALSEYDLSGRTIQYKRAKWTGFTGSCRFYILSKDDEFWVRLCNLLAEYSFYCGTGHKTAFGLGQTKRLYEMDRKDP